MLETGTTTDIILYDDPRVLIGVLHPLHHLIIYSRLLSSSNMTHEK